jgi:hypothetical protein
MNTDLYQHGRKKKAGGREPSSLEEASQRMKAGWYYAALAGGVVLG